MNSVELADKCLQISAQPVTIIVTRLYPAYCTNTCNYTNKCHK